MTFCTTGFHDTCTLDLFWDHYGRCSNLSHPTTASWLLIASKTVRLTAVTMASTIQRIRDTHWKQRSRLHFFRTRETEAILGPWIVQIRQEGWHRANIHLARWILLLAQISFHLIGRTVGFFIAKECDGNGNNVRYFSTDQDIEGFVGRIFNNDGNKYIYWSPGQRRALANWYMLHYIFTLNNYLYLLYKKSHSWIISSKLRRM